MKKVYTGDYVSKRKSTQELFFIWNAFLNITSIHEMISITFIQSALNNVSCHCNLSKIQCTLVICKQNDVISRSCEVWGVCPLPRPFLKLEKEKYQNLDSIPLSMLKGLFIIYRGVGTEEKYLLVQKICLPSWKVDCKKIYSTFFRMKKVYPTPTYKHYFNVKTINCKC